MTAPTRQPAAAPRLRALTLTLPVLGGLALLADALLGPPPAGPGSLAAAAALALAALGADLRPVRIGPQQKTSLATVPALVAALLLPTWLAASALTLAALAANVCLGRRPRNAAYNAGMVAVAVSCAGLIGALGRDTSPPSVVRAAGAEAVFSLVTIAAAAAASAAQRETRFVSVLVRALHDSWPQALAMDGVALAAAVLLLRVPWAAVLPLAVLPLVLRLNRMVEAELESKSALERLLAVQRRFLTDVSHQVGNPLGTIRMNLSIVGRAELTADQRVALTDASSEAGRLAELFRRLRVLAETDEDVPLHRRTVDLAELASELVHAYRITAETRGVELRERKESPATVDADADLLRQAAANLLENAIRHTPRGHAVTVRVTRSGQQARLDVVDEGAGIEPSRLAEIFERFRSGPGGGSGLGLAIARNVVERHGGRIEVESQPGAGSRFSIFLPASLNSR